MAGRIAGAYAARNTVAPGRMLELIQDVHAALANPGQPASDPVGEPKPALRRKPAVPASRSVFPDHIVCLEDGAKLVMLTRYLRKRFNLTPTQYRKRWGLPPGYPMVAPNHSKTRSASAQRTGRGRKPGQG